MNKFERLAEVQKALKAPKNQYNSFGNYKYRSCEDILEAVKPLCIEHGLVLHVTDEIVYIGERYYIKATAIVHDIESGASISNSALAREAENKKGMDESQITGTASSYARKYALNGLFCIDDTKDADTDEHKHQTNSSPANKEPANSENKISAKQLLEAMKNANITKEQVLGTYKQDTGKTVSDIKYIKAEYKEKYYNMCQQ